MVESARLLANRGGILAFRIARDLEFSVRPFEARNQVLLAPVVEV